MKKGKFIVIEGTDGSGKATQLKLLYKRLRKIISKILLVDFPRYYDSVWGEMVGEFLVGKYGKFEEVDPHLMVLPYMIDQYTWSRDTGKPWIEKGGIILADRYFTSNVHQIAKLKTRAKKQYRDWLWPAGYDDLRIMRPDLVVFLDVPPDISKKLNLQKTERLYLKGKRRDLAERSWRHQELAYIEYLRTVNDNTWWVNVRCTSRGNIDSIDTIHERVWNVVSKKLDLDKR